MSEPLDRIIIDADLCIKLGNSEKYPFLREVLPLLAKDICIHACAYDEVKMPHCAVEQLLWLVENGKVKVVPWRMQKQPALRYLLPTRETYSQ